MRLSNSCRQIIKSSVSSLVPSSQCYLFGSRTIDAAKGGDIDILLITPSKLPLSTISQIRRLILDQIGEQKIDIVNFTTDSQHPFKQIALEQAIEL